MRKEKAGRKGERREGGREVDLDISDNQHWLTCRFAALMCYCREERRGEERRGEERRGEERRGEERRGEERRGEERRGEERRGEERRGEETIYTFI